MESTRSLSALLARLPDAVVQGDIDRPDATIQGKVDIPIAGLARDSRLVKPGDLFVCLKGEQHDAHRYAAAVLAQGATAVVVNSGGLEAANVILGPEAVVITVRDTRQALPLLACAFYGEPSQRLQMVGVTGTNGKTTTTRMIAAILRAAGKRVGTIGTLGSELDGRLIPSDHTTPEADQLQALLAQMLADGAEAVVMEASSHALAQHRTDGIAFNAAVFTNLTQDHLDFHATMDAYFEAKALLFEAYPTRWPRSDGAPFAAVINVAQPEGQAMAARACGEVLSFAPNDSPAMLHAINVQLSPERAEFSAVYEEGGSREIFPISLPIGGAFQVGNALGAIGACLRLGIARETITRGLAQLPPVPGRFEAVPTEGHGFSVIVDYAHTPDGLDNLLRSARELRPARLLVVFGCGGNRDRTKRPKMGRLAGTQAEIAIVTSDNPRHEAPEAIIAEILTGMDRATDTALTAEIHVEPDRRKAIALAIGMARPGDIVLIAGKGHEDYQIVGDAVLPFDDRLVAKEILADLPTQKMETE